MALARVNSNWSELLHDLLGVISSYLSFSDVNRFSAVCKQWRFIAKQRRYAPIPQLPWLVLTDDPDSGKRKLFNMSEKRHYYIDIPELRGGYCVGSSFGWLFIVSSELEGYLLNPFNRAHYRFPPLPLYTEDLKPGNVVDGKITYEENGKLTTWPLEELQKMIIRKAVLSKDPNKYEDFITIIILQGQYKMAFCRPKDNKWTIMRNSYGYYVDDVICYKGNIYAIGESNYLYEVHLGPQPKMKRIEPQLREFNWDESRYLVDFFGKHLLLVHREIDYNDSDSDDDEDDDLDGQNDHLEGDVMEEDDLDRDDNITEEYHPVTCYFVVFELDLEKKTWHKWKNLGGNALFLGSNRAIAIRTSEFPDCKADCIYFTPCSSDQALITNDYGYDDLGVYNLIDKRMEKFYEDHIPTTSMPVWLVPNP